VALWGGQTEDFTVRLSTAHSVFR